MSEFKKVIDHLPDRTLAHKVNRGLAIVITKGVGTMYCAYAFTMLALVSLPSTLGSGNLNAIVAWVAQTFLQLVLLSVIIVGQNISAEASDARALKTFEDTELIIDRLDVDTKGGLQVLAADLTAIRAGLEQRNFLPEKVQ